MDFDSQYEVMMQKQLTGLLEDFLKGKGKACETQRPLFDPISKKYVIDFFTPSKNSSENLVKEVQVMKMEYLPVIKAQS